MGARNEIWEEMSREELIEALHEERTLNRELFRTQEEEKRLELSKAGNLGHWYWNVQTNSVVCNPLRITTLGYAPEEIPERVTYQFFTDRLHPGDYQRAMTAMQNHLSGYSSVYEAEYRIRTRSGAYKWYYDWGKITQYDESGNPLLLAGIALDITEDKTREEILRQRAEQDPLTQLVMADGAAREIAVRLSFNGEEDESGLLLLDIDSFRTVNTMRGRMFGDAVLQRLADLLRRCAGKNGVAARVGGDEFLLFLPKTDRQSFRGITEQLQEKIAGLYIDDEQQYRLSISVGLTVCRDKDARLLIDNASAALCHAAKYNAGFISVYEYLATEGSDAYLGQHMTSPFQMEDKWEHENIVLFSFHTMEQISDLKAALHVLFCRVSRQYPVDEICITRAGEKGERSEVLFLWSAEHAFLLPGEKVAMEGELYDQRKNWLGSGKAKVIGSAELRALSPGLQRFLHCDELNTQLICPVYVQGAFRGNVIFGSKAAGVAWSRQAAHSLHIVSNVLYATICKVNAESASRAKTEFLSRMSHEIRTPLNAIVGMIEIAKNDAGDGAKLAYCLSRIDSSARYLLSLINNVLEMSRLQNGRFSLQEEPFSIEEAFSSLEDLIRGAAGKQRITYRIDCCNDYVMGDAVSLQQILTNLIVNAIKFTPDSGSIEVSAVEAGMCKGKRLYRFSVQDTGIGISARNALRISQLLKNGDGPSAQQGTGLGLAVSGRLAAMMGGRIQIESEEGKGSRFFFTLPFYEAPAKAHGVEEEKKELKGLRVLLIDDNVQNLEVARELLVMHGAEVETACDGSEGLSLFSASADGYYDVVVTDIRMPVMNGLEAAARIRKTGRSDASVPIVAVTGDLFDENGKEEKESGINIFLSKPVDIGRLARKIRRLCP